MRLIKRDRLLSILLILPSVIAIGVFVYGFHRLHGLGFAEQMGRVDT